MSEFGTVGIRTASATAAADRWTAVLSDLRAECIPPVAATLAAVASALVLYASLLRRPIEIGLVLVILVLLAAGIGSLALERRATAAAGLLVAGLALGLAMALTVWPQSALLPWLSLVGPLALALLGWRGGLTVTAATTLALALLAAQPASPVDGGAATSAVLLSWAGLLVYWLATRPAHAALRWARESNRRAEELIGEVRARQAELAALSKSLTETCYRLEVANRELERARRAADQARRLKTEFAAAISHELRTPLNLIIGFSELMIASPAQSYDEPLPECYAADIETIYENASHISTLIDDILDLSQIDAQRMALQKRPSSLWEIAQRAVSGIAARFRSQGLELTVDASPDLPTVDVDPTRLRQVLINLLINALRATDRGSVAVRLRREGQSLVVSVADTGVGIAPEHMESIFEEFGQAGEPARRRGGSGLGLAVSKRFVEMHGGNIWAESRLGQGSTFHFSLPLSRSVVAQPYTSPPPAPRPAAGRAARPALLVLDADGETTRVLQRYLDGYDVVHARSADDARRAMEQSPVRAVVVSSASGPEAGALPVGGDGFRHLPVVTCPLRTTRLTALGLGVARYLAKPVTRERLSAALQSTSVGPALQTALVADDDPEMARLLARMIGLYAPRCEVWTARDGLECLELVARRRPEVLILDLLMPRLDGYGVLRALGADAGLAQMTVIVVTAKDNEEEAILANSLTISREGGMAVGEVVRCLKGSLDGLLGDPLATPPGTPAGSPG